MVFQSARVQRGLLRRALRERGEHVARDSHLSHSPITMS